MSSPKTARHFLRGSSLELSDPAGALLDDGMGSTSLPVDDVAPRVDGHRGEGTWGDPRFFRPTDTTESKGLEGIRRLAWLLIGLQLIGMLVVSTLEYQRYALSVGFGAYSQAWLAIAHGHLDPVSTLLGKPFWRNNAEFILWPLSLLYRIYPSPIDLLWVGDIAVVATELVAFGWILDVLERRATGGRRHFSTVLAAGALAVLLLDPFCYYTITYDFHSEVLAALFVILAARSLWAGRTRSLVCWTFLAMLTSGLGALYVIGVGLSGIFAGSRTRRAGAMVAAAGFVWLCLISVVGGNEFGFAHSLTEWYGYLLGPHRGTLHPWDVVLAVIAHPWVALHTLAQRWYLILDFLLPVGLIGLASPWAWPIAVVVIVPSALNANVAFLNPHASFQTWPCLCFVVVGTVMILDRLAEPSSRIRRLGVVAGVSWAAALVVVSTALLPDVSNSWLSVSGSSASQLARLDEQIPSGAEVVTSWRIAGRFAHHGDVYAVGPLRRAVPIDRRLVVFVIAPGPGTFGRSRGNGVEAANFLTRRLGARPLLLRDDVYGFEWSPSGAVASVQIPPSIAADV